MALGILNTFSEGIWTLQAYISVEHITVLEGGSGSIKIASGSIHQFNQFCGLAHQFNQCFGLGICHPNSPASL